MQKYNLFVKIDGFKKVFRLWFSCHEQGGGWASQIWHQPFLAWGLGCEVSVANLTAQAWQTDHDYSFTTFLTISPVAVNIFTK